MFLLLFGHGLRGSTKVHQNSAGSAFDALAARCARLFHASSTFSPQRCANPDSAPRPKFSSSKRLRSRVRAAGCTGCVIFSRGGTSVRASPLSPQPTYLCRSGCATTSSLEVRVASSGFHIQPHGAPPPLPARARLNRCKPAHFFGAFCAHTTPSAAALGAHGPPRGARQARRGGCRRGRHARDDCGRVERRARVRRWRRSRRGSKPRCG